MASIYQYLDTNGDDTGEINAVGDYSSTPEVFYIQAPLGKKYELHRLIIAIEDSAGFRAERYGNLTAALTNGIEIKTLNDDGETCDLTDHKPIKTNAQWGMLCYDVDLKTWGAGDELLVARLTFEKAGEPLIIDGDMSGRLEVQLNDDFTGLVEQHFMVQGVSR